MMRTFQLSLISLGFGAGFMLAACGDDGGGTDGACTPGEQVACACPGGGQGAQICHPDGTGFGPCECVDSTGTDASGTDTTSDGTTTGETNTTSGGSTTTDTGGSTSGASATSTTGGSTTGNTTNTSVGTTGGSGYEWLANDGFTMAGEVAFQQGFVAGECWASVYVAAQDKYPFEVNGIQVLIGGSMAMQAFNVRLYNVDGNNMPTTQIDSVDVQLTGADDAMNEIDFDMVQLQKPVISSGAFAIAICPVAHDGLPSIGRDVDGTINASRNWIFAQGLGWVQSMTLGLQGDWIMRARVSPM